MVTSYFSLDTGNKETNQLSENTIVQTTWVTAFLKLTELIETVRVNKKIYLFYFNIFKLVI